VTNDSFLDLRESPQLFAFIQHYLPGLRKEAARLRELGAKRITQFDASGDQYRYQIFVRYNPWIGQRNDDIIPAAIAFFEAIRGRTFDAVGLMNGNGLMYLGLGPRSFLPLHQDYPDGTHVYNRVVLPLEVADPDRCMFTIAHDGIPVTRSFGDHPYGYTFNPAARHAAVNDSDGARTVITFQLTRL
jgi:hypothetical protein